MKFRVPATTGNTGPGFDSVDARKVFKYLFVIFYQ